MICELRGVLRAVNAHAAIVDVDALSYDVLVPAFAEAALQAHAGEPLTLHTVHFLEGNPAGGNLTPRLIGFLTPTDRAFFQAFTKVKGVSTRKALRAMCLPTAQLAAAIEQGDAKTLASLPEIGKKSAANIIAEMSGKLAGLGIDASGGAMAAASEDAHELTDAQRVAVDILVSWGDRRAEAMTWVRAAVDADPALAEPESIVRAAYRRKQRV